MNRTPRDRIVTVYEHDLVGQIVLGNFGRGTIEAVRWCAIWEDKQVGIRYEDDGELCIQEVGGSTELVWEDLDEIELIGDMDEDYD